MLNEGDMKACPFCGSKGVLKYAHGSYGYYAGKYRPGCSSEKCGAEGPAHNDEDYAPGRGMFSVSVEAKDKCVRWWNRRALSPEN